MLARPILRYYFTESKGASGTAPGAPVCDRLKAELGSTRLAIFNHRADGMDAQSRLQAGAPPVLLSEASVRMRPESSETLFFP